MSRASAISRPAGRVLVADLYDRILLIRVEDQSIDEPALWITPGGACEGSESSRQAAIRELREETGIQVQEIGPCVWRRRHIWRWGDRLIDSLEYFYFLRLETTPVITSAEASQQELGVIREYRWWGASDLQDVSDEVFVPRNLPDLVPSLLAGEFPVEPIDVGE